MILKGQNFRILIFDATANKFKCIGMASNCVVTDNSNTNDVTNKDDVGLASKPKVTSQNWQVQVDSLDVSDTAAMLNAAKSFTPFTLLWDETSTTDNQEALGAAFARSGMAYLADATFNFNNREVANKNLQFVGTGGLSTLSEAPAYAAISAGSYTMGQNVRLFLGSDNTTTPSSVIGSALNCSLHISVQLEVVTTKDTVGDYDVQSPVSYSYDISTSALMRGNDTITSAVGAQTIANLQTIKAAGNPVKWFIANVGGENNRTKISEICSGSCIIQTLTLNGPNRQKADYTAQMISYGPLTVAA